MIIRIIFICLVDNDDGCIGDDDEGDTDDSYNYVDEV